MDKIEKFDDEYRWLSNFHPAKIVINGTEYSSVEHFYQSCKCPAIDVDKINEMSALKVKRFCNKKMVIDLKLYPELRMYLMGRAVRAKFNQHNDLADLLLATGDAEIIEGNHWEDTFWGVCDGVGENRLGKLLMTIRDELKQS